MKLYTLEDLELTTDTIATAFKVPPRTEVLELGFTNLEIPGGVKATVECVDYPEDVCDYVHLDGEKIHSGCPFDEAVLEFLEFGDCWVTVHKSRKMIH
jgi:hypothetical protein